MSSRHSVDDHAGDVAHGSAGLHTEPEVRLQERDALSVAPRHGGPAILHTRHFAQELVVEEIRVGRVGRDLPQPGRDSEATRPGLDEVLVEHQQAATTEHAAGSKRATS